MILSSTTGNLAEVRVVMTVERAPPTMRTRVTTRIKLSTTAGSITFILSAPVVELILIIEINWIVKLTKRSHLTTAVWMDTSIHLTRLVKVVTHLLHKPWRIIWIGMEQLRALLGILWNAHAGNCGLFSKLMDGRTMRLRGE